MPHLEITEEGLVHGNIVKNGYQKSSRVLYTFISNKLFGQLIDISANNVTLNSFDSEFLCIKIWFTD